MRHAAARCVLAVLAPFVLVVAGAPSARADDGAACVKAHVDGQVARKSGKLREARASFEACSRAACPEPIRDDCTPWLGQVRAELPSVVVEAVDARGAPIAAAELRVIVDGALAESPASGAMDVDPGERTFRFETTDGRSTELRVTIVAREKLCKIVARFPALPTPEPSVPAGAPVAPSAPGREPTPVSAYALGGLGVAAGIVFGVFAVAGKSKERDLRASCAPYCSSADIDVVRRDYLIGDVSLLVGAALVGTAAWIVFSRPTSSSSTPTSGSLRIAPNANGASLVVGGSF